MPNMKLNKEEQELLASVESGEWRSVRNLESEKKSHKQLPRQLFVKTAELIFVFPREMLRQYRLKLWNKLGFVRNQIQF